MKGKYIVFEGPDGSGKTTIVEALWKRFDQAAVTTRFPSDGKVGSLIRSALRGDIRLDSKTFLYLFAADGLQENDRIRTILQGGMHVICDRHPTLSGRVFQADHHDGIVIEDVYDSADTDGLVCPDFIFVVDAPPETLLERQRGRDKYKDVVFEKDSITHVEEIRDRYLRLARRHNATILDGTKTIDAICADVIRVLTSIL